MISTILLSGGVGSRSGKNIPKQYCDLLGKKIINYCLEELNLAGLTSELIIVYGKGCLELLKESIEDFIKPFNSVKFIEGGLTRQESVYNGLLACSHENVLLHESARPLVTKEDLLLVANNQNDNVTMGIDIPFTVLKKKDGKISEILNRDELFNVQLPQKFNTKQLILAHEKAKIDNITYTDDSSLLFAYNSNVAIINGSPYNIKITAPKDFVAAEEILKNIYKRQGKK